VKNRKVKKHGRVEEKTEDWLLGRKEGKKHTSNSPIFQSSNL
jgi:hypothetical protein